MNENSRKLIFFGTEDFSLRFLMALVTAGYDVRAVVTKPDSKKGRGQKITSPAVKTFAQKRDIPVWQPSRLSEIKADVESLSDAAGVLVSYGKIIPTELIELFDPGIINVHPSLLPRWRGPSPIESAILNGDDETGVSIMQLSADMDAGPVYGQARLPLRHDETKPGLYDALGKLGETELLRVLPSILDGSLQPTPQVEADATYCPLLTKADGTLDPQTMSAEQAERHIRAFLGFPKSRLALGNYSVIVTKAHVSDEQKTPLDVAFSDGRYLSIDELVAPSGKTMSASAYLRGYEA